MHKIQIFTKNEKKLLTNALLCARIYRHENKAELCKGSTADSDSVCLGSNPSSAAIEQTAPEWAPFFLFYGCGTSSLALSS